MSVLFNIWCILSIEPPVPVMLVRAQPRWAHLGLVSVGAVASDRLQLLYLPCLS